jgi:hypothetical protein
MWDLAIMHPIITKTHRAANHLTYCSVKYPSILHWSYIADMPAEAFVLRIPATLAIIPVEIHRVWIRSTLAIAILTVPNSANLIITCRIQSLITLRIKSIFNNLFK